MKSLSLCIFILLISYYGFASPKNPTIDSLELNAKSLLKTSPIEAVNLLQEAKQHAIRLGIKDKTADLQRLIGDLYNSNGVYDLALKEYLLALEYYNNVNLLDARAWMYINIGNLFHNQAEFSNAIQYYNNASTLFIQDNNDHGIATCYSNIGMVYQEQSQADSALYFFHKALTIRESNSNIQALALCYRYIGTVHSSLESYDTARKHFNIADSLLKNAELQFDRIALLIETGHTYSSEGKHFNAIQHYNRAYDLFKAEDYVPGQMLAKTHILNTYLKFNLNKDSLKTIAREISYLADSLGNISYLSEIELLMKELTFENKNYLEAYQHQEAYYEYLLDARSTHLNGEIAKLELKYQTQELGQKLLFLQQENELKEFRLNQNMYLIFYSLLIVVLLYLLVLRNLKSFHYNLDNLNFVLLKGRWVGFLIASVIVFLYYSLTVQFAFPMNFGTNQILLALLSGFIAFVIFVFCLLVFRKSKFSEYTASRSLGYFSITLLLSVILLNCSIYTLYNFFDLNTPSFFYSLSVLLLITLLPAFLIIIFIERLFFRIFMKTAEVLTHHLQTSVELFDDELITINSPKSKDKISVMLSQLYYVESKGNYAEFCYNDGEKVKKYVMLITMKETESALEEYEQIKRCHKSFIINLSQVEKLVGNSQGYKLRLKELKYDIPVSRSFPKEILQRFKS